MRIEAQAKAGEILREREMHRGGRPGKTADTMSAVSETRRLGDDGISDKQSSRWQHVASIPEPVRQDYVEAVKEVGGKRKSPAEWPGLRVVSSGSARGDV